MMTTSAKVLRALQNGKSLTTTQVAKLGAANPTALISALRRRGYAIYRNSRVGKANTFRLGTPTRSIIAAGISAVGM